jgi:hypothetical protein
MESKQFCYALEVPLTADSVDSPIVNYGGGLTVINFLTKDGRWGRVTFEKLDSIKISRGEYEPYPAAPGEEKSFSWVSTASNSQWLTERYEYEKRHYGTAYNFGGNVEEMLTDFSHYIFRFHDQFVEVLCDGIWFESADTPLGNLEPDSNHPLLKLPESTISERFKTHGITCQVRRNPRSIDELKRDAKFCSQTILEIATELDGRSSVNWTLSLRVRDGILKSSLRSYFGKEVQQFDSTPSLTDIRPKIDAWLAEVHERRKKMGKA